MGEGIDWTRSRARVSHPFFFDLVIVFPLVVAETFGWFNLKSIKSTSAQTKGTKWLVNVATPRRSECHP